MKKWFCRVLMLILLLSCAIPALAAEGSSEKDRAEADVIVKLESVYPGTHVTAVENREAEVTTEEGITLRVTDTPEGVSRLVVIPVPETEKKAWQWIESSLEAVADPVHTFHIYFEDPEGNRLNADGATVSLTCSHCDAVPVVCSLDTDGSVHKLSVYSGEGSRVTFVTNGSPYYIMAQHLSSDPPKPDTPPTGDDTALWLWQLLSVLSAAGIGFLLMQRKKTV